MKITKYGLTLALCLIALTVAAHADSIQYSASGTFSSSTPISTLSPSFSGPGDTWAFSFQVDRNPTVFNVNPTHNFEAPFSNFSYLLNGSPVAITPSHIKFFSTQDTGALVVCFSVALPCTDGIEVNLNGTQLFMGSTSAPTMTSGPFTPTWDAAVNGPIIGQVSDATVQAVSTPEPSSALLLGTGLLGLMAITWRRKRLA